MPTDLTTITYGLSQMEIMGGTVLAALAFLWGVRKMIKTINRS